MKGRRGVRWKNMEELQPLRLSNNLLRMDRDEFYVYLYLSTKVNNIEFPSNRNTGFTNNNKPTLHLQDEFDVAL